MNNGESVIISVPPLTEERRRELAKWPRQKVKVLRWVFVLQKECHGRAQENGQRRIE